MAVLLAASASSNPIALLFAVVYLVVIVYCAYLTARNRHWLLFILGFVCGGLFWIVGALLGPKSD